MKFTGPVFMLAIIGFISRNPLQAQVAAPPFTITLEEITYSDWPGLHSFALGEWEEQWFIMTGRSGGLHGFIPPNTFPKVQANNQIHQFDPLTGEYQTANLLDLSPDIRDQLQSTNPQHFQRGKYLYIVGGYGYQEATDSLITFPALLAVDLEMLSNLIATGESVTPAIRRYADTLFEVSGGEIGVLEDKIYLFGGHIFAGEYSKPAGPQFFQQYTNAVKKFNINDDGINITVSDIEILKDTAVFHRRDLNFVSIITPGEEEMLAAFSGVFQYEGDFVWFSPVYINDAGYAEDESFYQKLNNYTCPVMGVYDSVTQNYYATFFGGIGQYYYKEEDDTIKQDLNVPFVNDISTVIKYADGTTTQYPQPIQFDALLGTNAVFVLNSAIPHYTNEVIQLHNINGEVFAGYIYGGIDALIPNFTPSTASNRLFKVFINYEKPIGINDTPKSTITIFPNPTNNQLTIINQSLNTISKIEIVNQIGEIVLVQSHNILFGSKLTINVSELLAGIYFVKLYTAAGVEVSELVKH